MEHHIPFEIITEIMSWLPVKSLLRFKDASFTLVLDGKYELFEWHRRFHGLMIVKDLASQFYYIRNPATRQTLRLIDPLQGTRYLIPATSINKSLANGVCKLLSFYTNTSMGITESGFQILTVNRDKQWRPLKFPDDYAGYYHHKQGETVLMTRKIRTLFDIGSTDARVFLWMTIYKDIELNLCLKVLSFHIMNEHFSTLTLTSLPQGFFSDLLKVYLMSWNECPAVAEVRNEALNVLVLEQDSKGKKLSCKSKVVVPLRFSRGDMISMRDKLAPITGTSHRLIFNKGNEYFMYDMKSEGFIRKISMHNCNKFKPSLVTLEGMISENQNNNEGT
ncbi:hypothetical protein FNV43_RR07726 [Rhamnella rubrinervis]|uniref:F-box domain-containing protein n=1 Tax=Rhamnella rubrinervis TaxID=2594499 RepID=A0A8K0HFT4_9ROSA|nr:hypothetical protein FNV43_RR07726 [Rhamnella rubrinervis]